MHAPRSTTTGRSDTETHCHCGASYNGSDHCPSCCCEQYESGDCGFTDPATTMAIVVEMAVNAAFFWDTFRDSNVIAFQSNDRRYTITIEEA